MNNLLKLIRVNLLIVSTILFAQNKNVLITTIDSSVKLPDPSSKLHLESSDKGFLYPRISLKNNTDNITVKNPIDGVTVFDTKRKRHSFWYKDKWNIDYIIEDAKDIIPSTLNITSSSNSAVKVYDFPDSYEEFHFGDSTYGWTFTGVENNFKITNNENSAYYIVEGMASINNNNYPSAFGFAVAIFVDSKLVTVRKYFKPAGGNCVWSKFALSGILKNQTIGSHNMGVYVKNLQRVTSNYDEISYGGVSTGCSNINRTSGKIYLTNQISEIRK